jgi:hypothetical protein
MIFNSLRRHGRRLGTLWAAAMLAGASQGAHALAYGALSNFDVYNDSSNDYYGFEIELQGLHKSAIPTYDNGTGVLQPAVFTNNYHVSLQETGDAVAYSTIIRYEALFDPSTNSFDYATHPFDFANSTPATDGHSCVVAPGCEHFGAGYYGNPTGVKYHWLTQGATPGTLVQGPAVNLVGPIWNVIPAVQGDPNQAPEVEARVEPPEVEPGEPNAGVWVKTFFTEHTAADVVHGNHAANDPDAVAKEMQARLNGLMSGNDAVVPEDAAKVETEWEFYHTGEAPISHSKKAGQDAEQVVRRYEIYAFNMNNSLGLTPDTCTNRKGSKTCDPTANPDLVGNLLGAQMGALNLDLQGDPNPPAPVPVPAALPLLVSALGVLRGLRRREV